MSIVDLAARVAVVLERPAGAVRPVRAALAARAAGPPASAAHPAPRDPASRRDPADLGAGRRRVQQRRSGVRRPGREPGRRPADVGAVPGLPGAPAAVPVDPLGDLPAGRRRRRGPAARRGARPGHRARRLPARPAALRPPGRARGGPAAGRDALPRGCLAPGPARRADDVHGDHVALLLRPLLPRPQPPVAADRRRAVRGHRPDQGDGRPARGRAGRVRRAVPRCPTAGPRRPPRARRRRCRRRRPPALARPVGPRVHGPELPGVAALPAVEPLRTVLPAGGAPGDGTRRDRPRRGRAVAPAPVPQLARGVAAVLGDHARGVLRDLAGQGVPVPARHRACRRAAGCPRGAPDPDAPAAGVAAGRLPVGARRRGRRRRGQPRRAELARGQPGADHDVPRRAPAACPPAGRWAAGSTRTCRRARG